MIKNSKIFLSLSLIVATVFANAQERIIDEWELPKTARDFVATNFSGQKIIKFAKEDKEKIREYKVLLENTVEIEFDDLGYWKEVEGKNNALPTEFIPIKIMDYVKTKYPAESIGKIEKNATQYEVELRNGTELKFNLKGKFLKIDD